VINKENDDDKKQIDSNEKSGIIDVAKMDTQCHILIKDKDTDEILVNKRG
jgi:hypothetical protein